MAQSHSWLSVIIPALNAEHSIGAVVRGIRAIVPDARILVVDDGSTDQTGPVAEACGAQVVTHSRNQGKGAALNTGFQHVLRDSTEWVVTLDADGQHDPADMRAFLQNIAQNRWDLLLGNRMASRDRMPWPRVLSNTITSWLISQRLGQRVADAQCGFRAIRRKVLETMQIAGTGFTAESELLLKAGLRGFRIGHVSVQTIYSGETSHIAPLRDTGRFILLYLRSWGWE